jgi:transcriptional regulator with XRE-family HTH domain
MESDEPRFKHIGLSSDGAVIFCELDNGKTYAMPLSALETAERWDCEAAPRSAGIVHDGYAAEVEFDSGVKIDFPSDFVLHVCDQSYGYHKSKARSASGVGGRIREIRKARGLTLDALASKCGIAKPNLSRLENNKVTPTYATINSIAAALQTHPALLVSTKKPEDAWTWTLHAFTQWKLGLLWNEGTGDHPVPVPVVDMVKVFLATRPEHEYARLRLLKHAVHSPRKPNFSLYTLDSGKWGREASAVVRLPTLNKRSMATT